MLSIDSPLYNDNRNYDYSNVPTEERNEYKLVCEMVEPNSKVIDLGCGNGSLMEKLIKEKQVVAEGIELSDSGVEVCKSKGLNVHKGRIDEILPFENDAFDYSICNVTIQMVMYPEVLLSEMKRISRYQIISFPNFAHYKNRLDLLLNGRMPKPMLFGYKWYSTGHIHQLSIKDFYELVEEVGGLRISRKEFLTGFNPFKSYVAKLFPNLFVPIIIFEFSK
ncbi:MAG: methyltransferase domain-containing protein [Ignavibacteriaceae bacterium]|nr:methyltransferase domain-containing protein [Ignavibacteriaceae bacterium]